MDINLHLVLPILGLIELFIGVLRAAYEDGAMERVLPTLARNDTRNTGFYDDSFGGDGAPRVLPVNEWMERERTAQIVGEYSTLATTITTALISSVLATTSLVLLLPSDAPSGARLMAGILIVVVTLNVGVLMARLIGIAPWHIEPGVSMKLRYSPLVHLAPPLAASVLVIVQSLYE